MRNLINVRCWSRLTYLNILSYRNLWDTRTLGTLTIIFVNIPAGFLCHRRHYRHCTPALTPSSDLLHDTALSREVLETALGLLWELGLGHLIRACQIYVLKISWASYISSPQQTPLLVQCKVLH